MGKSLDILSKVTTFSKYAKHIDSLQRRETFEEVVDRSKEMYHQLEEFQSLPSYHDVVDWAFEFVYDKKVLTSMRGLQFGGESIIRSNNRVYNCAYMPMEDIACFHELMFLLLGGSGVGYSVQKNHVSRISPIQQPSKKRKKYLIQDSIIGWADAIKALMKGYTDPTKPFPKFDFSEIRPKGAPLKTTGGKAPGPEPLRLCINHIMSILNTALSERGTPVQLKPVEVHDINCHIADAVLSGGIRRSAMIALFTLNDDEMFGCKSGDWPNTNPQRALANNSVFLLRHKATEGSFKKLWDRITFSGFGEPGIYWSNDKDWGANPCVEIALKPYQFCNLTTINANTIVSQEDFNDRARAAATLGTLQATLTDFHYLRPIWQQTTQEEALLGVSLTGIASGTLDELDCKEAARCAVEQNREIAEMLGINPAARVTTIKPEGTASLVLGTSSGIHAWHDKFYIRRMSLNKEEPIYKYLARAIPQLLEDSVSRPSLDSFLKIPIKAPEGAILSSESTFNLLKRVKRFHNEWIRPGHVNGHDTLNVSVTLSVKESEWGPLGEWMWKNRHIYNGIALFPYNNQYYPQAPFESITEEEYHELTSYARNIDLTKVIESEDMTSLKDQAACAGGACEII